MYFDNKTSVCIACPANCLFCKSLTLCTVCLRGAFMASDNLCYTQCPNRQFANNQTGTCQSCPYDCLTCNVEGRCLSCNSEDIRKLDSLSGRCVALPTYFDNSTQKCGSCPKGCLFCSSLNNSICSSCISGYFLLSDSLCHSSCPARYFGNVVAKLCQPCPYDCLYCDTDNTCTNCSSSDNRKLNPISMRCEPT